MRLTSIQKFILITLMALAVSVIFAITGTSAQQGSSGAKGLTISPPLLELNVKSGQSYTETISLSNPSKDIMEVYPVSMNFTSEGEGGQPSFYSAGSGDDKYSLASWISFSQPKIAIAPEQIVEFKYTVTVPKDAEPGGHYGVVFFSTQPPQSIGKGSQVAVSSMIGSLIMVKTDGAIVEQASLENFEYRKIIFSGSQLFETRIFNLGNIHIKPVGEIDTEYLLFSKKDAVAFNSERGNVLPSTSRNYKSSWTPGKYRIGPYSAELKISYGTAGRTINQRVTFWYLPWWSFVALVVLAALVVLTISLVKRRNKGINQYFKVPK